MRATYITLVLTVGLSCFCLGGVIKDDGADLPEIDNTSECLECSSESTKDVNIHENLPDTELNTAVSLEESESKENIETRRKRSSKKSSDETKSDETNESKDSSESKSDSSSSSKSSKAKEIPAYTTVYKQEPEMGNNIY